MATERKATCAKDNVSIFVTHLEHKVFNRNKESFFDLKIPNEIKVIKQVKYFGKVPSVFTKILLQLEK